LCRSWINAIILLIARLGLRGVDIRRLEFADFACGLLLRRHSRDIADDARCGLTQAGRLMP